MAFAPGGSQKKFVILVEIEVGHRIDTDTWTQHATYTNCWWISHPEGKPSQVKENGSNYIERSTLVDCNANPSSWYWDTTEKKLYVHTSGSNNPGGGSYIILSYFWRRVSNHPYIFNGKPYRPGLKEDSIPSVVYATSGYHEGSTQQTFGSIKVINNDGYYDTEFSNYIYEGKRFVARVGEYGAAEADFTVFWNGWTGDLGWSDTEVEMGVEDLRAAVLKGD